MDSAEHQLEGLKAALKRGTRAASLRVVAGVCDKQHTMAEVYRGDDNELYVITFDREFTEGKWVHSRFVKRLPSNLSDDPHRVATLQSTCRCNGTYVFEANLLSEAIANGNRRVVVRVST